MDLLLLNEKDQGLLGSQPCFIMCYMRNTSILYVSLQPKRGVLLCAALHVLCRVHRHAWLGTVFIANAWPHHRNSFATSNVIACQHTTVNRVHELSELKHSKTQCHPSNRHTTRHRPRAYPVVGVARQHLGNVQYTVAIAACTPC